jgi:hypothetical protein
MKSKIVIVQHPELAETIQTPIVREINGFIGKECLIEDGPRMYFMVHKKGNYVKVGLEGTGEKGCNRRLGINGVEI